MSAAIGILLGLSLFPGAAKADLIGGVEFPDGAVSFADVVWSYDPVIVSGEPSEPHRDASSALGIPDYSGDNNCTGDLSCAFVSLGDGGSITLRFTDNSLTASGDATDDLWIFEVGPDVEDTFVEISMNGTTWHSVGSVGGATSGVDIDAFGWTTTDFFSFVRLIDNSALDGQTGITVGADIDAVGAISSGPSVTIPEPGTIGLFGIGLLGLGALRRHRQKRKRQ